MSSLASSPIGQALGDIVSTLGLMAAIFGVGFGLALLGLILSFVAQRAGKSSFYTA